jgi:sulfur carrier protein
MQIVLNGKPCEVVRDRLDGVLEELGYQGAKVATAVNGNFIARPVRAETQINDGDRVEVIAPMQGG